MSCCSWQSVLTERKDLGAHEGGDDASFCIEAGPIGRQDQRQGCEVRAWPSLERGKPATGGRGCACQAQAPVPHLRGYFADL